MRPVRAATAALVALALLPLGDTAPTPAGPGQVLALPVAATSDATSAAQPAPAPSCDPRQSLRPSGPLPAPGRMPTGSPMERIVARGRLIAGIDQNTYLFAFRDPTSGELQGFDVDVVHDLAAALFGDPNQVEFRQVDTADRLAAVQSGSVDLVVDTLTVTCDRQRRAEFSGVYLEAGQRVLVDIASTARGLDDLAGRRVCAARGSTSLHNILVAPSHPVPVGVPAVSDCLVMLQLGEIDAISTDDALLVGLAAQDPRTKIVGEPLSQEPYAIAVNLGAPDLVRFVNAVLEQRARDGRWAASYARWLAPLGSPPPPPQPRYRD